MRRSRTILAVALVALLAGVIWFVIDPTDERTQLLFNQSHGTITTGTKLSVTVGETWGDADAAIRSVFTPAYAPLWETKRDVAADGSDNWRGASDPVLTGEARVSYRDRSWRNGGVVLDLSNGLVTAVHWNYGGPFYSDL